MLSETKSEFSAQIGKEKKINSFQSTTSARCINYPFLHIGLLSWSLVSCDQPQHLRSAEYHGISLSKMNIGQMVTPEGRISQTLFPAFAVPCAGILNVNLKTQMIPSKQTSLYQQDGQLGILSSQKIRLGGGGDVGQRSGDTDVLPVNLFDAQPLDQPDLHNGKAQLAHSTLGICAL